MTEILLEKATCSALRQRLNLELKDEKHISNSENRLLPFNVLGIK